MRAEELRVHAPAEDFDIGEACRLQRGLYILGRDKGRPRAIVKPAEKAHERFLEPAVAVVLAVGVKVCVVAGNDGDAELLCCPQGRHAEGTLGGDVDEVGLALAPIALKPSGTEPAKLQARVAGDRVAAHEVLRKVVDRPLAVGLLFRAYDGHVVPAFDHAGDEAVQRHGHAVDFGRKGFGDEGDLHAAASWW